MPSAESQTAGVFANVAAAILLGGRSERMGRDKAALSIGGVRNDVRTVATLSRLSEEILIVGGEPVSELSGRHVVDADGPPCALRGLVAGLEATVAPRLLVVATDMPLLTLDLLLALVAWPEADVVVPETNDGIHPLCAIYRRESVLPVARDHLLRGVLKLSVVLDSVDTSVFGLPEIAKVDPAGTALTNVNTPEEMVLVDRALSEG